MSRRKEARAPATVSNGIAIAAAELNYERSKSEIEVLAKDEEIRKLRLSLLILKDDVDGLNHQAEQEAERADHAETEAEASQEREEEAGDRLERTLNDLRLQKRELDILKTELSSLRNISTDSTKLLEEKLALSRELANLKPECSDLRTQVQNHQQLLAEKLSLQHKFDDVQAELENGKRTTDRLRSKDQEHTGKLAVMESRIEELKKELAKEKSEKKKLENEANRAKSDQVDDLKAENATQVKQIERLEKAIERAKSNSNEVADLKLQLAEEKQEKQAALQQHAKAEVEFEAQRTVLEDKLTQFRTKLRTTKEKLKETEAELLEAQKIAKANAVVAQSKPTRKRVATQMDPDAAIGTPGDANVPKRNKRASSVVGEKSTFSITPFLNRTASVAPESNSKKEDEVQTVLDRDEPVASIEAMESPSAQRSSSVSAQRKPLAIVPSSKSNISTIRQKTRPKMTLEKVAEEVAEDGIDVAMDSLENEEDDSIDLAAKQPIKPVKLLKSTSLKPKSLNSYQSFREGSIPLQQSKKTRKLGSVAAKTLFDEDEGENEPAPLGIGNMKSLGGQRPFGGLGARAAGLGAMASWGAKKRGPLMVAEGGFMFSPLKKDRRAARAASEV